MGCGQAIELAVNAAARRGALIRSKQRRGFRALDAVATTAPFFGAFGSGIGIIASFKGGNGEKTAALARLVGDLSDPLVPFALSVCVASTAWWIECYLRRQAEAIDRETALACHDLMTYCLVSSGRRDFSKNSF